ncbi:hypothetical protein EUO20_02460 [Escherichia coli]|nr:hypothetical protein [Escherichia coli]
MKPAYKPVLCVVSSHPIKGASGVPTGFFLAELTHPLKVLEDAGIKTTIASIRGGQPPVDGFDLSDPVNAWYWNETDFQQRLAITPALSELKGADYSAVFFAGGHGTMWDFRDNQDAQRIIREVYESDGIVSAVCHGPAALVDAKLSSGEYLIKGKKLPRHMLTLPHFQFIYALMGAERILFSVDYPYQTLDGVKTFIDSLPVNKAEKEAIAFRNAERLLGITV